MKIRLKVIYLFFFLILSASVLFGQETNSTSNSEQELTTFEQLEKLRIGILSSSANRELLLNKAPKAENFVFLNTSVPYYHSSDRALVRDENSISNQSFIEGLKESFHKNFIVENRWKMILDGMGVTIVISIASGFFCFLFGFVLILIHRKNIRFLSWIIKAFVTVINGLPAVVLLMLLYYVIFASLNISPIIVSILAFTLTFGSTCYGLIGNGIQAVNVGQEEAAKALGYTEFQSFYKIVFPQAARQFLPLMKGEFISMVKMTSVVGFITCIDLTKASDLIRSRTMEAFFPLIITALIYFAISYLMIMVLNKFEISLDPKRRERKIEGVVELRVEN